MSLGYTEVDVLKKFNKKDIAFTTTQNNWLHYKTIRHLLI